ncbi:MAG: hypothetical protein JSS34_08885, partial [Proteobacteria bacterium]|nr:hypothetical protein [Pseudomonadota bacterium]
SVVGVGALKGVGYVAKLPGTQRAVDFVSKGGSRLIEALNLRKVVSSTSVWLEPPVIRGMKIEKMRGQNLHKNFTRVDRWNPLKGIATSIKSLNVYDVTYQNSKRLMYKLRRYVREVSEFKGAELGIDIIEAHQIKLLELEVAVPSLGTPAQQKVFEEIITYGMERKVDVKIIVIPK